MYLWLFFPQLHVVYAQWTNVWSLNYYTGVVIELVCGYWTAVWLLNWSVVIELLCGYWTNKKEKPQPPEGVYLVNTLLTQENCNIQISSYSPAYLVSKPLPAAGISEDNARGEASSAN